MATAYEVLGLDREATDAEIRKAYRELARRTHPDRHSGSQAAHERFLAVKAAYEVLIDPKRRAAYDIDPERTMASQLKLERRAAQKKRRRERLRRLYET